MTEKIKLLLLSVTSLVILNSNVMSQKIASPLEPEIKPLRKQFGGIIGFGQNFQSGIFDSFLCERCLFEDGTGFGFTIGALYQQEIFKDFWFGGMLRYDMMNLTAAYKEREAINFVNDEKGIDEIVPIWFLQEVSTKFSYISIMPYLNFTFLDYFYVRLAPVGSLVLTGAAVQTQKPTDEWILLSTGDTAFIEYDIELTRIGESDFPEINRLQIGISLMIGFDILLRQDISLSPVFEYYKALTNISDLGTDFRVNRWRLLFELRIDIQTPMVKTSPFK